MDAPSENAKDILALMHSPSTENVALVEKAYAFAKNAHKDHKRLSGEPYFVHLEETAKGLASLGMGAQTVAAGLLHDSVEDVGVLPETIEKEFGKEIRFLVEGVTKLGHLKYRGAERHRESLRKLLVATSKDARVLLIKLMDRLHNMRTLAAVRPEKRQRIALETLEIYAAIAHRLGLGLVRRELEDLAFEHAYPEEYVQTHKLLGEQAPEMHKRLADMAQRLKDGLVKSDIKEFEIDERVKGLYSLWNKLKRKSGDIGKVYDIAALRVVVSSVADCYRVLGIVHELWQPLPNKIKDYIAFPKPNGYRSLHTTVFAGDGGIVEIQIRTPEMHEESVFGIASHVFYKERSGKAANAGGRQSSFDWIKSLIPKFARMKGVDAAPVATDARNPRLHDGQTPQWLQELGQPHDDSDFETTLKTDIFSHRVFVFTPKGDVVDLPASATPVDFAYAIHSDIGDHIAGAKVNGKMVPLDTTLHNGDIVHIDTKKNAHPTSKWLDIAKTTLARRHIRTTLEKERK